MIALRGNSADTVCITDASATSVNGVAIAGQCCDGSRCLRRTSGSNADCIFGSGDARDVVTYEETLGRCESLGYTLCDRNCKGQGCSSDRVWVWTSRFCS